MSSLFALILLSASLGPIGPDAAHEPQMVVNGPLVAVAFGAGKAIYFSASSDSGKTFAKPVKVAEAPVLMLTRHRGPQIALSGPAIVITAVAGDTAAGCDLISWRSSDGGHSWSKGVVVNDVHGAAREGLQSLASDAKGNLFAVWLDDRSVPGKKLYGARSADGGLTWSKNIRIYESPDGTICQCCRPSVAMDSGIVVMWRNWLDGSRDMYIARSKDGISFSKSEKLGAGTWKLNACPMDGGGIAISKGRIVTAWRREHEIFLASPGEREIDLATGMDVAIAAGAKGVYAIWSTPNGVQALLPGEGHPLTVAPRGSYPDIAALPNGGALAAWEDDGRILIQAITQ